MQQALDSPAAAKGLDDSYQPVPDVRDDPVYFARLYDQYATDVLRVCYFYLSDREKSGGCLSGRVRAADDDASVAAAGA